MKLKSKYEISNPKRFMKRFFKKHIFTSLQSKSLNLVKGSHYGTYFGGVDESLYYNFQNNHIFNPKIILCKIRKI